MSAQDHSEGQKIRASLRHPIVDADGHWLEFAPVIVEQLRKIGGDIAASGFVSFNKGVAKALAATPEQRKAMRRAQEAFWAVPTRNTLDRATELLPKLLYERLDEFGIDFTVLYPTSGLGVPFHPDTETRRATCRAFNTFIADYFGEFSDRMTPAAVIPVHTPEEAIEELEHVKQLGLKVVMMASMVRRSNPAEATGSHPVRWFDMLALDSEYDYDPLWAKCVELGISPTFHSGSRGLGTRVSPTNFVYNHIGHFAAASEAVCKAMFMGGVTRRFPTLKMGFLEGGVGWACALYADLIGHWKKRNREALEEVNPANLDTAKLATLVGQYGGRWIEPFKNKIESAIQPDLTPHIGGIKELDDYSACKIKRAEDIRDLFVNNFYFGCEADDPLNSYAFNRKANPYGAKMNVLFGSDIGHFDVQDMKDVVPEAYELVEDELITENDFRDFMFTNPVRFWGEANPKFFDGTRVEKEARALLNASA
ncbi:MAG TPA: amidohydrolase family protein [Candidatus Binataceae bacterium]|nr:amidohydrolase family protein [Candidatus Binataceae bacterium]